MPEDSGNATYPPPEEMEKRAERGDPAAQHFVQARRIATGPLAHTPDDSRIGRKGRLMSGTIMRLARRLGKNPDEMAAAMPEDTVRRTKNRVLEDRQPDGSTIYKDIPVK